MVYDIERRISHYLLTITCINAGLGLSVGISLHTMGLPDAHIWGTVAFFLNFLPYVGSLVGTILVGAFAIVTYDSLVYRSDCARPLSGAGHSRRAVRDTHDSWAAPGIKYCIGFTHRCLLGVALGYRWRTYGRSLPSPGKSRLRSFQGATTLRKFFKRSSDDCERHHRRCMTNDLSAAGVIRRSQDGARSPRNTTRLKLRRVVFSVPAVGKPASLFVERHEGIYINLLIAMFTTELRSEPCSTGTDCGSSTTAKGHDNRGVCHYPFGSGRDPLWRCQPRQLYH